jgi:carboxymethylenebutenolidase
MMNRQTRLTMTSMLALTLLFSFGQVFAQEPLDPAQTNVTYQGPGGINIEGYLAKPPGSGTYPGVLMIHEWWGLNYDITVLADALAQEGFVVLAPDAFRGSVARTPAAARKQVTETPREQIAADLNAAFGYLQSHSMTDPDRIAVMGFCFGGTQAMYMGTRSPEPAAVVIFYGSGPIQEPGRLGSMKQAGPVLGIYGKQDNNIPVEQVRQFEDAMDERNIENTITTYPGVGHAFVKSDTYQSGGPPEQAWKQMVNFLEDTLKK